MDQFVVLGIIVLALAVGGFFFWKKNKDKVAAVIKEAEAKVGSVTGQAPTTTPVPPAAPVGTAQPPTPVPIVIPPEVPASLPKPTWPKLIARGQVIYNAVADLNPDFKPSLFAGTVGGAYLGVAYCFLQDPSNAPEGYSSRSPKGYPLFYAIGGDGKPVGDPVVVDGDEHFNNDDEIAPFWAAAKALQAKNDAVKAIMDAARAAIRYTGPVPADSLSPAELGWIRNFTSKGVDGLKVMTTMLSGTDDDMRRVINASEQNSGVPGADQPSARLAAALAAVPDEILHPPKKTDPRH